MADPKTNDKIAAMVRGWALALRVLVYGPPMSTTDTALGHLHSLRELVTQVMTRKTADVSIVLELHRFERDTAMDKIDGLDPLFAGYANDCRFKSERRGLLKFIDKDGKALPPERFSLGPTFRPEDVADEKTAKDRMEQIERLRDRNPRILVLSWNLIKEALETGKRVDDKTDGRDPRANLYQAVKSADGKRTVLWVATLPRLDDNQRPDQERHITVSPNQGGVLVQLTAPFLDHLLNLLEDAGGAEDGIAFARSYYVSARRETVATLTKSIEEDEAELAKKRKRLSELTPSEPVLAG